MLAVNKDQFTVVFAKFIVKLENDFSPTPNYIPEADPCRRIIHVAGNKQFEIRAEFRWLALSSVILSGF